jgi:hypothetical protein
MLSLKLPFKRGRVMWVPERDEAIISSNQFFGTNLSMQHFDRRGRLVEQRDLGSGLVTNVGVDLMAWNDEANVLGATLSIMTQQAIGTGATAAAAADYYLQTPQGTTNLSGTTNGYMAGAQSVVAPNQIKSIATFTATGAIAVTEWILAMSNAAAFTGRSATSTDATHLNDTGAAFTTAGNGLKGWAVEAATTAINTPTTTAFGIVTANTATALTVGNGWFTLANAGASTPGGTTNYVVYPAIWDHKVFSVVNLANGDSIQFTYTLTINSGG